MRTVLLSRAATAVFTLAGFASLAAGCEGASAAPEPVAPPIVSLPLPVASSQSPAADGPGGEVRTFAPRGLGPLDGRPYKARIPSRYDKSKPTPLVVLLHGFGASGELQEVYLNLSAQAESRTVLYAYPDGTQNPVGLRFWNSQEWCCDFFKSGVDDVAYVTAVIDDLSARYNVDKKRIYLIGHSNGGFMAHRMACELSGRVAAIVSLAGAQQNDPTRCLPKEPVSVLQVHGTLDLLIGFGGAAGQFPGARESVAIWANRNGCTGRLTYSGEKRDLDIPLLGAETKVEKYTGCPATGAVELWSIQGGGHVPVFTSHFAEGVYDFFAAHPKP
jgi:polyhydroxybutyrate depolymerase